MPAIGQVLPTSHYEVLHQLQQGVLEDIQSGKYRPFLYPYCAFGINGLLLYFLIPPSRSQYVYNLRYAIFPLICLNALDQILHCRSTWITLNYGNGLLNTWIVLWSICVLFIHDGRADFKRIEAVATVNKKDNTTTEDGAAKKSKPDTRAREAQAIQSDDSEVESRQISSPSSKPPAQDEPRPNRNYKWQSLPPTFFHRLNWVTELFSSLRYPRWSIAIPGLPPPPPEITSQLSLPDTTKPSPYSTITRRQLLQHNLPKLALLHLLLDMFKTLTAQDPYFWSLGPASPSPFPYPRTTRTFLSACYAYTALHHNLTLGPLFYACLLGPETIGEWAWPWLYSPYFGSLRAVSRNGLAGAWGQWWHQLFRFGFETMGDGAAGVLGGEAKGWGKRTKRGGVLRVFVAFGCSGVLHGCASYAALGKGTRPWMGSFAFFVLQAVGILVQRVGSAWMKRVGVRDRTPWWVREGVNVVLVLGWLRLTGPLVADDFAATGIWLFEPVPISLVRGLRGEGWWFWGGTFMRWYQGKTWWDTGLMF